MPPLQEQLGKILIITGIVLVIAGVIFIFGKNLPFGRLPGDISVEKGNFTFYFPIVTCIIISVILTLVFFLIGRK